MEKELNAPLPDTTPWTCGFWFPRHCAAVLPQWCSRVHALCSICRLYVLSPKFYSKILIRSYCNPILTGVPACILDSSTSPSSMIVNLLCRPVTVYIHRGQPQKFHAAELASRAFPDPSPPAASSSRLSPFCQTPCTLCSRNAG